MRGVYIEFVDYEKAFDSVDTSAVMKALRNQGVDEHYVRLLDTHMFPPKSRIEMTRGMFPPKLRNGASPYMFLPKSRKTMSRDVFPPKSHNAASLDVSLPKSRGAMSSDTFPPTSRNSVPRDRFPLK